MVKSPKLFRAALEVVESHVRSRSEGIRPIKEEQVNGTKMSRKEPNGNYDNKRREAVETRDYLRLGMSERKAEQS